MKKSDKKKKKNNWFIYLILFVSLLFIYSKYIEPYNLTIKEYKIESSNIPDSFDGIKIIHFSDIHYGRTVDNKYLKKIVKLINKQKPDIIIFTGDFLDKDINLTDKQILSINNILKDLDSTIGNYAVVGNHDMVHLSDYKNIMDGNFNILDNQEKILYYKNNESISFIGLADSLESKVDYNVLKNKSDNYRFVLSHEPDVFNKIKENDFDILLSGHSHNGQIRLPFIGAIYTPIGSKTYYEEHYEIDNKNIYVSNGIGTSGINLRFLSRPSINLYRLYSH